MMAIFYIWVVIVVALWCLLIWAVYQKHFGRH